jgi:hypothetical protein
MEFKTITRGVNIGMKIISHLHLKPPTLTKVYLETTQLNKGIKLTFTLMICNTMTLFKQFKIYKARIT